MADSQGGSKVILVVDSNHLWIKTTSNIDLTYKDTGITVDDGKTLPLGELFNETSLKFANNPALIEQLKHGKEINIKIGFWPTWPVTQAHLLKIPLDGFQSAHQLLESCQQYFSNGS